MKFSREKTFTNSRFYSHPQKFSPRNFRHATPIYAISLTFRESFLPSYRSAKVSRYMVCMFVLCVCRCACCVGMQNKVIIKCHSVQVPYILMTAPIETEYLSGWLSLAVLALLRHLSTSASVVLSKLPRAQEIMVRMTHLPILYHVVVVV